MGRDSKIVICGDTTQYDLHKRRKDFGIFATILEGIDKVKSFAFERSDIVRNPLLVEITDKYEKYKSENNLE
jgi:phosphate starvation-inducible protein PhoH